MAIAQNKPLVFRDGTSQQQRWKGSLSPGYALVDDRDRDDLFNELRVLAAQIAFYNDQNQLQGDWTTFIPDEKELEQLLDEAQLTQDLSPHVALLIAFLRLFRYAQDDLNQITERHLDFYYQEVLQLKHLPPAPDQVHVLFELARNVDQERQVQGALLKAGKDPVGKTRYYALDKEIVIHQARVSRLMSSIVDAGMGDRIFCAPVADSADGLGAELPDEDRSWAPLGESQFGKAPENRSMSDAEHGFAIVSPALRLGEGERKGTLDLYVKTDLAGDAHGLSDSDLKDAFRLGFSTAKGWFESKLVYTKAGPTPDCIRITWTLSEKDPAVEVLPENFDDLTLLANEPILKVFLNHQAPVYRYGSFSKLQLKHLNFEVTVKGLKNLSLSNDDAKINAEKSFFPFGALPRLGASFFIGGEELKDKSIKNLTVNWQWADLPTSAGGFTDHYAVYQGARSNYSFKADVAVFSNNQWAGASTIQLFDASGSSLNRGLYPVSIYNGFFTVAKPDTVARLQLSNVDFGHAEFSNRYAEIALAIATSGTFQDLPNQPYTPKIKSFTLDYTTSFQILFPSLPAAHRFLHLEPFGHFVAGTESRPSIVPSIPKGCLYIGVEHLDRPRQLNFLAQCIEGSSDPGTALMSQDIEWSYLMGNDWTLFPTTGQLGDETLGLQRPGIIQLVVDRLGEAKQRLPQGFLWVRAATNGNPEGAARVLKIALNAARSTLTEAVSHLEHLKTPLPEGTISRLNEPLASIKRTAQPFPSFGGKSPESQVDYYRRVSERLRHKQRAITAWDYERIVLQAFPELYKVKCLAHTWDSKACAPGRVSLVVIPEIDLKNARDRFQPKASPALRERVRQLLVGLIPNLFVEVAVVNPCYEPLQVVAKIAFRPGFDPSFYLDELNRSLQRLLAPWAFGEEEDIAIGGQVYGSAIIKFIEIQPYVDYVYDFKLHHFPCQPCLGEMFIWNQTEDLVDDFIVFPLTSDPVSASTPVSVLVSAETHLLSLLGSGDTCQVSQLPYCGVGQLAIEQNFVIA